MKPPQPVDLQTVVQTFETIPELAAAGVLAGANALYLEHIKNDLGRFSLDIDLQNQTDDLETVHRVSGLSQCERRTDTSMRFVILNGFLSGHGASRFWIRTARSQRSIHFTSWPSKFFRPQRTAPRSADGFLRSESHHSTAT